jgi:hypothetical protein
MRQCKLSTARSVTIFMADSSDHVTGKTGLTLTITASKDGAAFASITPTVTELATGWYKLALTASHTDTLGDLALHITGTGADPSDVLMQVVTDLPGVAQTGDCFARLTGTGAVTFASLTISGATTFTGAVTGTNASNDLRINGIVPGAAGGLFIAGTNAATTVTTAFTTAFTGNLTGSVASIATGGISSASFAAGATIPRCTLVDTTTVNTDMRGTDGAALASVWTATLATHLDTIYGKLPANAIADETLVIAATDAILSVVNSIQVDTNDIQANLPNGLTDDGFIKADVSSVFSSLTHASYLQDIAGQTRGVALMDGAITDAKITAPGEVSGRPTTILAMVRRIFEWMSNKRTRDRDTGTLLLRNTADNGTLETQTQSTVTTTDTISKGV